MAGQVKTIYSDAAKQNAVFPRTKVSAVSDNSGNGLQGLLDAKAPIASPALTGTPTAPTAAAGTNTTQLATTAFVQNAVGNAPTYTAGDGIDISNNVVSNTKPMNYEETGSVPSATPLNADQLQGHPASYFQKLLTAGNGIDISNDVISSKLNMDLLWTNSSITSAFSPQDVFLDLSDYRFVYISFFQATNGNYYCSSLLSKLGVRDLVSSVSFSGNTNPLIARAVTVTDDTVYFGAAYAYSTYGAGTLNNNFLVPFRIYGIK